jgi:hypothetical protein
MMPKGQEERPINPQEETHMTYQTPRAMQKQEIKADIAKYETTYKNQTSTLSQFFAEHVVNAWDATELSAAELITIKDNLANKQSTSLIILQLKSR